MKYCTFIFLGFLLVGCLQQNEKPTESGWTVEAVVVPDTMVLKTDITYINKQSLWTVDSLPYSGYVVSYYADGALKEKLGILNGKKQNKAIQWFNDGHLKIVTHYDQGKLHGEKKLWSADSAHILIAKYNYHNGKAHGEQTQWYTTGELYKKMNLKNGKEEGIQQAYRKNGAIYANYEAREGRIFGLKKAALCYGLEDENIKSKK